MRLQYMVLRNFRQFYGESPKIVFAQGKRNITTIHACNGAGKTALLNAFTWVLYEKFSRGFQFPEQIVNKRAIREARKGTEVPASVELGFEHDGVQYRVQRETSVEKADNKEYPVARGSTATLEYAEKDGNWRSRRDFADVIGRILPEDLHTYFFFDGERIERLVQPTSEDRRDINRATKKLLGVELLDRAERHLISAKRLLEDELKRIGDADTRKLLDEKARLEAEFDKLRLYKEDLLKSIGGFEDRKQALEKQLRAHSETKALQEKRDDLNRRKQALEAARLKLDQELRQGLTDSAYTVFLDSAIGSFRDLIDGLRKRGELPAGIKRQFVADLLAKERCICDRPLEAGSKAREAVEHWMAMSGLADVEETAIRMGAEVQILERTTQSFWSDMDRILGQKGRMTEELSQLVDELDDISEQLKGSPREEVSKLQSELEKTERAIREASEEKGRTEARIATVQQAVAELERAISKHRARESKQLVAQRRVDVCAQAIDVIVQVRGRMQDEFRNDLERHIKQLFRKVSYTPYVPELDSDYALRLLESAGGDPLPVAASQGECQILSLCFIGSIIQMAREFRAKRDKLPGPDSSTFPLVMDSPFGSLDSTYRTQIASHIPALADQVILMVTNTQWKGEVEESSAQRVGATYVLTYFTPEEDVKSERITVDGQRYDLRKPSPDGYEYTRILEVKHG